MSDHPESLHDLLGRDHDRLDALLASALRDDGTIDEESYRAFRAGLLQHIAIEERVLFREVRRKGGESPLVEQLHRDHAALAALLVPAPAAAEIGEIRAILVQHNPLEEEPGGFYDDVERIAGDDLPDLIARARALPPVRVAPHADSEVLRRTIEQLLAAADEGRRKLRGR